MFTVYCPDADVEEDFIIRDSALSFAKEISIQNPEYEVWVDYYEPETIALFVNGEEE